MVLTGGGQVPGIEGGGAREPGTIEHSRCRLDLDGSVSRNGPELVLALRLTIFQATSRNVDLHGRDRAGSASGWVTLGQLTVQADASAGETADPILVPLQPGP